MKYELQNGWKTEIDKEIVFKFSEGYKDFLTQCKTERESVSEAVRLAKKYDGDDTGSFVNGILGSFARGLSAEETK